MLDDFDMNIQCDEYLDYLDQLEEYFEWADRFEETLGYEED